LSGDFVVDRLEDAYSSESNRIVQTLFSFDEAGGFKRAQNSRLDEGVYLINTEGVLVMYVEKTNGQPLTEARTERYSITEEKQNSITLRSSPTRSLFLKKR